MLSYACAHGAPLSILNSMKTAEGREAAMKYQNEDIVRRFAEDYPVTVKQAQHLFEQTKMFLIVCSVSDIPFSPSKILDEMWHYFVLHTKDYRYFCETHIGFFLDHVPTEPHNRPQTTQAMIELATKIFGDAIDLAIWPKPEKKWLSKH